MLTLVEEMKLSVATEFSETPGPRAPEEGDYSGELFLGELLRPRYEEAVRAGDTLTVDLDGTEGYATSFLEAAFGGLGRLYEAKDILKVLRFKCDDEPYLVDEIRNYIMDARNK
jgi:STAS-like domain of unknown function (DUF4325)